jgi:hypothetical protein
MLEAAARHGNLDLGVATASPATFRNLVKVGALAPRVG